MTPDTPGVGAGDTDRGGQARRIDPETIRTKFSFDLDDQSWLGRLCDYTQTTALGRIGSFDLLEVIGRGAQGIVYKARQPRTGRIVAIKRLSAGAFATPQMRDRFRREVEAAAALEHPGIVTVFGSEIVDGQAILAMQWIDGRPFHEWAQGRPPREILAAFVELCDAVQHAHQRGVIHRDIKPTNILVDQNGHPHVLDFGVAKLHSEASATLTMTGDFLGTPLYAAPEQVNGRPGDVDVRTDVYSLGAVLYQSLTGRTLFPGATGLKDMLDAILSHEPAPPSSIDSRLDREIDAIVVKAVLKDKELRYASVDALRTDVQRYLLGEMVLSHPPSFRYLARKMIRRHRSAVITSAAFLLLLLAATATSTILYVRAENARLLAQQQESTARLEVAKQEAVNQFLQDMLRRANRIKEKGKDLTMQEVLDAAAAQLDSGEATYEPQVEAALRMTIALSYSSLGASEAERHLRRALELRRQIYGDVHPAVLESAYYLARVVRGNGQFTEAESLFELVLKNRLAQLGPKDPYVAQTLTSIGILQRELGKYAEAETTYRQAMAIYRDNFGEDDNVADTVINLAQVMVAQGRSAEAESLFRQGLDIGRRVVTDEHEYEISNIAVPLVVGANVLWKNGLREEARQWMDEAAEIYRKHAVEEPAVADQFRGGWALDEGDLLSGEVLLNRALEKASNQTGTRSSAIARVLILLARLRREQGRLDESEQAAREAASIYIATGIGDTPDGVTARITHANSLVELEKFQDAESILISARQSIAPYTNDPLNQRANELADSIAQHLVRLYESWNARQPGSELAEKAAHWRKQLAGENASTPQ